MMAMKSEYKDSVNIAAVERTLRLMETICYEDKEMGIKDIAEAMGEYPSTIYRVISTLMNHGYLYQNPDNSKYGLGYKVHLLGRNVEKNSSLIKIAKPYAEDLAREFKECVNVAVRDYSRTDDYYAITIHQEKGGKRQLMISESFSEPYRCYYSSVGKVLLAYSDDLSYEVIKRHKFVPYTPYTITDPEAFREELKKIRERGYAVDDMEQEMGLCCVGCPVLNKEGHAVMALSVSGYEGNIKALGYENIASELKKACGEMSQQIR